MTRKMKIQLCNWVITVLTNGMHNNNRTCKFGYVNGFIQFSLCLSLSLCLSFSLSVPSLVPIAVYSYPCRFMLEPFPAVVGILRVSVCALFFVGFFWRPLTRSRIASTTPLVIIFGLLRIRFYRHRRCRSCCCCKNSTRKLSVINRMELIEY